MRPEKNWQDKLSPKTDRILGLLKHIHLEQAVSYIKTTRNKSISEFPWQGNAITFFQDWEQERMRQVVEQEWGEDLIRGWNQNWWNAPLRVGEKIARLIGAESSQVIVCDSVSIADTRITLDGVRSHAATRPPVAMGPHHRRG